MTSKQPALWLGRLRHWHRAEYWSFVFSDYHQADFFAICDAIALDNHILQELRQGAYVVFELLVEDGAQRAIIFRPVLEEELESFPVKAATTLRKELTYLTRVNRQIIFLAVCSARSSASSDDSDAPCGGEPGDQSSSRVGFTRSQ